MAHLWFRDTDETWTAMPLGTRAVDVSVSPPRLLGDAGNAGSNTGVVVARAADGDAAIWVLVDVAGMDVRVNGLSPVGGLQVLQDGDEIRISPAGALFFASVSPARVEEFSGGLEPISCARCSQPMEAGQPAVRCPQCGLVYHQLTNRGCWVYGPNCCCSQKTALDAGYEWVPED